MLGTIYLSDWCTELPIHTLFQFVWHTCHNKIAGKGRESPRAKSDACAKHPRAQVQTCEMSSFARSTFFTHSSVSDFSLICAALFGSMAKPACNAATESLNLPCVVLFPQYFGVFHSPRFAYRNAFQIFLALAFHMGPLFRPDSHMQHEKIRHAKTTNPRPPSHHSALNGTLSRSIYLASVPGTNVRSRTVA